MAANSASTNLAATLGRNIRAARRDAGLTQHELAVALGRGDLMLVSRWERGEHRPNDENLLALANVLKRDVPWFYTDHERKAA